MTLRMGPGYAALVDRVRSAHAAGRNPASVGPGDIGRARLYCYGFRGQVIGSFHATRVVLEQHDPVDREAVAWRKQTVDALADLADLAMDAVPNDFRAVLSTFHHYDCGVRRVLESLDQESEIDRNPHVTRSAALFRSKASAGPGA